MLPSVSPPQPGANGLAVLSCIGGEMVSGAARAVGTAHHATTASAAVAKRILRITPPFVDGRPSPLARRPQRPSYSRLGARPNLAAGNAKRAEIQRIFRYLIW